MRSFNAFKLDSVTHAKLRAASAMVNGDEKLIHFKPPRNNPGLSEQKDLFRTFYQYRDNESFFKYINESSVCGYEVWLEDGEIEFAFYVPNEDLEKHYKKQLDTHYNGCELGPKQGKMINMAEGEYAIAIRFQLDNHYFEPLKTKNSPDYSRNPYRSIFGEMSLDHDVSTMIQFMFKPAEPDWTQLHSEDVEDRAEKVLERHSYKSQFFGLREKEVDPPSNVKKEAKNISSQKNDRGFYMDVRMIISGPDKYTVEEQASQITNLYEELFESSGGQKLQPDGYDDPERMKEIMIDIAQRNPKYMRQPKAPRAYLHNRLSENVDTLVMSLDELVSLAPIPYQSDFEDINGMTWADKPLEGAVSGVGETWSPPSEEEESEIRERLRGSGKGDIDSSVKTPSGDPVHDIEPDSTTESNENENESTNNTNQHSDTDKELERNNSSNSGENDDNNEDAHDNQSNDSNGSDDTNNSDEGENRWGDEHIDDILSE